MIGQPCPQTPAEVTSALVELVRRVLAGDLEALPLLATWASDAATRDAFEAMAASDEPRPTVILHWPATKAPETTPDDAKGTGTQPEPPSVMRWGPRW